MSTAHSGLSYMLKLGFDIIKIDKMFVDAIGTDRNSTTIVESLVDLARNVRMDVMAERVENFEPVTHLLVPPARRSHRSFAARRCGRDRAYQSVGLKHWLRRNEKGRPCDRPV
ncbi:MAG TPA: EAL domain-containing protein [Pseudolabrys sp.]|nr:EAL domain-containing protein [Pseudolabrys sp.]